MFVVHHACGLIKNLPPSLPRHETEIRVFQIKRTQQFIETAQGQKLSPVEGAASAAAIKAGEKPVDRAVVAMAYAQHAILPPALGEAGFLAEFGRIPQENLTRNGEYQFIRK